MTIRMSLIMPYSVSGSVDVAGKAVDVSLSGIPLGWVGSKGIFVGIMCAFLSVHIYTCLLYTSPSPRD